MPRRIARLSLIALLALAAALLASVAPAAAVARPIVLRADPPDGATLPRSPRQVRVWLSQTVDLRAGDVVLVDSAGHTTSVADARAEAYLPASAGLAEHFDAKYLFLCSTSPVHRPSLLVADLPGLGAGTYQLMWKTMLLGGQDVALGSLVFRVDLVESAGAVVEAASQPQAVDRQAGDLLLNVALRPNQPGQNFLDIAVTNTRRPAPALIAQVTVQIASEGDQGAGAIFPADALAEGRYRVAGLPLDSAGRWRITITVQRPGMADVMAIVPWEVAAAQPASQTRQLLNSRAQSPLAVALLEQRRREGKVTVFTPLWVQNALAVTADRSVIDELAQSPLVARVLADTTIPAPPRASQTLSASAPVEPNLSAINVPALWELGYQGQGVVVANMDTGVDNTHPDLSAQWRGGINSWYDQPGSERRRYCLHPSGRPNAHRRRVQRSTTA